LHVVLSQSVAGRDLANAYLLLGHFVVNELSTSAVLGGLVLPAALLLEPTALLVVFPTLLLGRAVLGQVELPRRIDLRDRWRNLLELRLRVGIVAQVLASKGLVEIWAPLAQRGVLIRFKLW